MSKHRTAMGKTIDMAALAARNEKVRAVGNMSVNARGDTIDAQGKVIVPANKKVINNYQQSVSNIPVDHRPSTPIVSQQEEHELTMEELELNSMAELDEEIEKIKATETKGTKNK